MSEQQKAMKHRIAVAVMLFLLAAVTFAVFAPSLNYPLMNSWDDPDHITNNARLDITWSNLAYWWQHAIVGIYMPFTMFTYMIDHLLWGLDPFGYRLQAVLWHIAAVLLFWGCCRRLGVKSTVATVIALCFAIHPQRVESVVWVSERKDVVCAAFYFLSIYLYLGRAAEEKFNWPAWIAFILALLSKPMAVSLPFVILCLEIYRRRDLNWRYYLRILWPWLAAAAVIMFITMQLQAVGRNRDISMLRAVSVTLYNVFWYVQATLAPRELLPIYPRVNFDAGAITAMTAFYLAAAGIAALIWRRYRESAGYPLLALTAAFGFALAPVAAMLHAGYLDHADRYSYIPSAFIWLALAWGWQRLSRRSMSRGRYTSRLLLPLVLCYCIYLLWYTSCYIQAWNSFINMIRITCMYEHPNDMALCELGLEALQQRNYEEAFIVAERLEKNQMPWMNASELQGQRIYAKFFRAEVLMRSGFHNEAEKMFMEILQTSGRNSFYKRVFYTQTVADIYFIRIQRNDIPSALNCLKMLLTSYERPGMDKDFSFYFYSGIYAVHEKDYPKAEANFSEALKFNPNDEFCRNNLESVRQIMKSKNKAKK